VHELMVQLARQGLGISLRSLQVWADLAGQLDPTALGPTALGPTALGFPAGAAPDLFDELLAAQREVVDELVATQRQFVPGFFATTTADGRTSR
jgi:hypothetical protein